jgi:hypothetical protein
MSSPRGDHEVLWVLRQGRMTADALAFAALVLVPAILVWMAMRSCGMIDARSLPGLVAVVLEVFVVNCAVVFEDNNAKTVGGASGFSFIVEKVIVFAEENAGAEGLVERGA